MDKVLENQKIRLQYSGFIIFAAKMLSIATGLAFTLMVTRATTEQQYGTWANISDVTSYFTFLAAALPFWTMGSQQETRREQQKTGILANLIILITVITILMNA